jgi:hypothetical protein
VSKNLISCQRRIYYDMTHVGNSADGHTFPDALDDAERMAVIECPKTQ